MKKRAVIILAMGIFLIACKNSTKEKAIPTNSLTTTDTIPFYPYVSEIEKEINQLTNKKILFYRTITDTTNKETQSIITDSVFFTIAKLFTQKNITQPPIKSFYKENLFTDLTTVSTVMSYTTNTDSLPIKNVDVLLNAKDNSEIKRIDMKVIYSKLDSVVTENYAWIFKKGCYINKFIETPNGKIITSKIKVSWEKK